MRKYPALVARVADSPTHTNRRRDDRFHRNPDTLVTLTLRAKRLTFLVSAKGAGSRAQGRRSQQKHAKEKRQ
jgi:hypothetical protein